VTNNINNNRGLASVINEVKDEFKEFVQTRLQMLRSEINEKVRSIKTAAPMMVTGVLFLCTAYMLLTLSLVFLVTMAFYNNPYRWFLSFLIVGVLWAIFGGIAMAFAVRELRSQGLVPKKTIKVLREDQIWLQNEARTQI
jgi:uncharacterized membrane protein YqjE